jgi:hypothetical protein
MLWQFEELGYDYPISYGGDRLAPKPIRWDYQDQWRRRYTKNVFSALAELKKSQPVFSTDNFTTDLTGSLKRIWLKHSTMDATVLGNFDVVSHDIIPDFTATGKWYEFYSGDSLDVQNVSAPLTFKPGEYRIYTTKKLVKPIFTGFGEQELAELDGKNQLLLFPNPSNGEVHVAFNISGTPRNAEISILSSSGSLLGKSTVFMAKQGLNTLNINLEDITHQRLPEGLYIVRLSGDGFNATGKVVIQH